MILLLVPLLTPCINDMRMCVDRLRKVTDVGAVSDSSSTSCQSLFLHSTLAIPDESATKMPRASRLCTEHVTYWKTFPGNKKKRKQTYPYTGRVVSELAKMLKNPLLPSLSPDHLCLPQSYFQAKGLKRTQKRTEFSSTTLNLLFSPKATPLTTQKRLLSH